MMMPKYRSLFSNPDYYSNSTCNVHQEPKTYWSLTTPLRLTTSFLPNLTSCRLMLMENLSMPTLSLKLQWSRMSQVLKDLWSWGRSEQHLTPVQKLYRWQVVSDPMGAKLTGWSQPMTRTRIYYSIATLFINQSLILIIDSCTKYTSRIKKIWPQIHILSVWLKLKYEQCLWTQDNQ